MKNLIKFHEQLTEWRNERHLSIESQRKGYIRNIMEELGELAEAIKNSDDDGKIDALCDILVFSLNCVDDISTIFETPLEMNYFKPKDTNKELVSLTKAVAEFAEYKFDVVYRLTYLYRDLKNLAIGYGYDLDKAMDETIKEISSRTGYYDDELKKFVKDKGFYTIKEYADYLKEQGFNEKITEVCENNTSFWAINALDGEMDYPMTKWYKADYAKAKLL